MSIEILGRALTISQVAPDGSAVRLGFEDSEGRAAAVILPSECIYQLLMTLPILISQAIRAQFKDESFRLVFPLAGWDIETSTCGEGLILTLRTPDGFNVAFGVDPEAIRQMQYCVDAGDAPATDRPRSIN